MKNKKFIISVFSIILINLIGIVGWWFVFSAIQDKKEGILQLRKEIDVNDRRLNNARSLNNISKEIEENQGKIAGTFLAPDDVVKFIEKLETLGSISNSKISIEYINLPGTSEDKNFSIQAKVSGSFQNLLQYLTLLENLPYKIDVSNFQFSKSSEDGQIGKWNLNFKIIVLSYENS